MALFCPVVQRNLLDVVQRELSEVYLAVLRIAQLHPVVIHPEVTAAHAPHVYGLYSAHPAIVFNLYAGEISHGIGNRIAAKPLQLLSVEALGWYDIAPGRL